ncbi:uncharacterized protein DS421_10g317100 [Arachis hypogaea]|nr:uncharacterized protein DS421_10g317100 [Arachis hypogaea]
MTRPNMGTDPIEGTTITLNSHPSPGFKANSFNLIGKIITDRELKYKAIKNSILGMWGNPKDVTISEVGRNKILISFKDSRTGNRFLRNGPWNVKGHLMNLQRWLYGESILDVSHDFMEFWIQVHGLPVERLNAETAKIIGDMIGIVGEVEDPIKEGTLQRNFLRLRVAINITQPLQTGFWLNRGNKPKSWISFQYERLQDNYCFKCGIIGHEKRNCDKPQAMACWDPTKPKYGVELGTERARPLHSPREEEALEQQIRENEAARGDQTLEDEGVNSKSTENDPKNQWVKEVEEIEVTSGEIKIKETDGRGGEKMEEQRGDIPLPQGRWPEDRDIRLLNILGTAAHNLRGIKGRSVMGGKEVSRKEKWTGPEGISQEKTRIQDGPSNWMRPNSPQVQDNRSKEMIEGKSNDKGLSKPQYPINLIHPGQDTIRAQRGGDCQYDHPANPLSGPSKQEMEKEGRQNEEGQEGDKNNVNLRWATREEAGKWEKKMSQEKKQAYKNQDGVTYYVELAPEDEFAESEASNKVNKDMKIWEEILSIGMQYNLKIKRKREHSEIKALTNSNWDDDQESRNSKRNKAVAQKEPTYKAEEAGPHMPPPQP